MTQEKETNRQAEQGKAETEIPCAVCRDLIPLVQDGVASPESEALVKAHLAACPACRALRQGADAPAVPELPAPNDGKILQKLRRRLWQAGGGQALPQSLPAPDDARLLQKIRHKYNTGLLMFAALGMGFGVLTSYGEHSNWIILIFPFVCAAAVYQDPQMWKLLMAVGEGIALCALLRTFVRYWQYGATLMEYPVTLIVYSVFMLGLCGVGCLIGWLLNYASGEGEKKVKSKRKMAGILAAVLIALVLLAFDCINGDPISERWAMHRAIQFAEKLYPDQTFTAENAGSMRGFCYTVSVQSQQSRDTRFYVETSFWLFTSDTPTVDHTQYVDARLNTAWRMDEEARADLAPALVDALPEYDIPYDEAQQCVMVILPYESGKNISDLGMEYQQWLPLDAPFEKDILQHIPAKLAVTIQTTSQPQQADLQPALQKIKAACEANGYHFATYNVTMIQRDIPYETALAQCIESGDVAAGEI